jgi:hypothetical protein
MLPPEKVKREPSVAASSSLSKGIIERHIFARTSASGVVKLTLKMKRLAKASSQKFSARFVVATRMPSRFSMASRQMF